MTLHPCANHIPSAYPLYCNNIRIAYESHTNNIFENKLKKFLNFMADCMTKARTKNHIRDFLVAIFLGQVWDQEFLLAIFLVLNAGIAHPHTPLPASIYGMNLACDRVIILNDNNPHPQQPSHLACDLHVDST